MPQKVAPRLRFKVGAVNVIGPGKIQLLEEIDRTGSISAAARVMGMSYKRAWQLVDEMNRHLSQAVVAASFGGSHGGGAHLTEFGHETVRRYRHMLATLEDVLAEDIAWLDGHTVEAEGVE